MSLSQTSAIPTEPVAQEAISGVVLGYAVSLALVAASVMIAFIVEHTVSTPNLSLVFVLPVVIAAAAYGWGPSLTAVVAGVGAFDFFFLEPRLTFTVAQPTDVWAMILLLVVAAIVSTVAARSRREALAARKAAKEAEALHRLAYAVTHHESQAVLLSRAVAAMSVIFDAPAVILEDRGGGVIQVAACGDVQLNADEKEAATWVAHNAQPSHADAYPFDRSIYDFWPAALSGERLLVLGVRGEKGRALPSRPIEMVAGYLAAGGA